MAASPSRIAFLSTSSVADTELKTSLVQAGRLALLSNHVVQRASKIAYVATLSPDKLTVQASMQSQDHSRYLEKQIGVLITEQSLMAGLVLLKALSRPIKPLRA